MARGSGKVNSADKSGPSLKVSKHGADVVPATYWNAPVSLGEALRAPLGPSGIAIRVYVNHGRWIAECPDCRGAQIASATDHRFMCNECANVAVGGTWRPVIWPEDYAEIDEALAWRPKSNQNWTPGETVDDLVSEAQAQEGLAR